MTAISIFDLDRTISRRDTFPLFLAFMLVQRPSRWWRIPVLALAVVIYLIGLRNNSWLKTFFLTQIVGGLHTETAYSRGSQFVHRILRNQLAQDALKEISLRREQGSLLVLATASPDIYVRQLADLLNISHVICSEMLAGAGGYLTGRLRNSNCYGVEKLNRIDDFRLRHHATWEELVIYTDHNSDLALLMRAGKGFAVNPSRAFAKECQRHGLPVVRWS